MIPTRESKLPRYLEIFFDYARKDHMHKYSELVELAENFLFLMALKESDLYGISSAMTFGYSGEQAIDLMLGEKALHAFREFAELHLEK